jgi:hypothetical protein
MRAGLFRSLLRQAQRLRPPPKVLLEIVEHASVAELVGRPGAIMLFDPTQFRSPDAPAAAAAMPLTANVCCPGCGEGVFFNAGLEHAFVGPHDRLSIVEPLWFRCCGWKGRLASGYWVGR